MAINSPRELFVNLLGDVRRREERTAEILQEISGAAKDADIKEALDARVFLKSQILATLDECFKLMGEPPPNTPEKLHDLFLENFRRELGEIKSAPAKQLYILARAKQLIHMRMGEYAALIAMADLSGHYAVGLLLESVFGEKLAFIERARRLVRRIVQQEVGSRLAA